MLTVDFHVHTIRSLCGMHTHHEMITQAAARNIEALAITDHGKALKGPGVSNVFIRRFPDIYLGVKIWKGIEANVLDNGKLDVPRRQVPELDIILAGLHPGVAPAGKDADYYTDLLLESIDKNPWIDILVHPDIKTFPLHVEKIVAAAAQTGMAVEFDNANITYGKTDLTRMRRMAEEVRRTECRAVLSSDAHILHELGEDRDVREVLAKMGIEIQFINDNYKCASEFIEQRRKNKI